jgi:hypothetical protein
MSKRKLNHETGCKRRFDQLTKTKKFPKPAVFVLTGKKKKKLALYRAVDLTPPRTDFPDSLL